MAPGRGGKKSNVGLSISRDRIELAVFASKSYTIQQSISMPVPRGMLDHDGDRVEDPTLLRDSLVQLFRQLGTKVTSVNLSVPGTLVRMVEMTRMDVEQLYLPLSSEAERYKAFDGSESVLDFAVVEGNPSTPLPPNQIRVVIGAVRQDTLMNYMGVLKALKIKVAAVDVEPFNILRSMAGTGVLDSLIQQIGSSSFWGVIFAEPSRVRLSIWQGNQLIDFREIQINTSELMDPGINAIAIADLVEEIHRSAKNSPVSIWLTDRLPDYVQNSLSERLGVPVRSCLLGPALTMNNPDMEMATVGSAISGTVAFPFPMNVMTASAAKAANSAAADMAIQEEEGPGATSMLIGAGVTSILLAVVATGILFATSLYFSSQVTDLATKQTTAKAEVAALLTQKAELDAKVSVYQKLKQALDEARIRNRVCVELTKDIQNRSPKRLWVQEVAIGGKFLDKENDGKIAFQGKAISHEDVLNFARSFDGTNYFNEVAIDEIKEELMGAVKVFNYKILGTLALPKELLPVASPDAATEGLPASNATITPKTTDIPLPSTPAKH